MSNKMQLIQEIEQQYAKKFEKICDYIFRNPELGGEEVKTVSYLSKVMEQEGFQVICPYGSEKTAFRAEFRNGEGPTIGFLAEYDALPGYGENGGPGHACGHNWIAAVTAGAAIVLSKMKEHFSGTVVLIGTPAEENYNGKAIMIKDGCFDDLDVALQAHLEEKTDIMATSLALDSLRFTFYGRAAHAAQYPQDGINALDAVQLTFAGINALRQHVLPDIRIHGIVTNGGVVPNVVPEIASCEFYVRGKRREYVNEITEKVKNCARGAALMTGTTCEIEMPDASLDNTIPLETLAKIGEKNMKANGFTQVYRTWEPCPGSTDLGNVSQICPTLFMEIGLDDNIRFAVHDPIAMDYVNSEYAYKRLHQVANALAGSALDLFSDHTLIEKAKEELEQAKKS